MVERSQVIPVSVVERILGSLYESNTDNARVIDEVIQQSALPDIGKHAVEVAHLVCDEKLSLLSRIATGIEKDVPGLSLTIGRPEENPTE